MFWTGPGKRPRWTLTRLDDAPHLARIGNGAFLRGFRLRPGTIVQIAPLLQAVHPLECNDPGVLERIESFCTLPRNIDEALSCLGTSRVHNPAEAARQLGVSPRTLQRTLAPTRRTPAAWLALARARRAARQISPFSPLANTALACGFSDQAHMSREFRRWFGISPTRLPARSDIRRQLDQPGYF